MLTAEQIRAARALLRMEQTALAEKAGVSLGTIKRLEVLSGELRAQGSTILAIRDALVREGVVFLEGTDQEGPGVRLAPEPYRALRDEITAEVKGLTEVAIDLAVRDDPTFFQWPVDEIAKRICRDLPGVLTVRLRSILGQRLPDAQQ